MSEEEKNLIGIKIKLGVEKLINENEMLQDNIYKLQDQLQQKEKSINKAIKLLNQYRNRKDTWGLWCMEYGDNAEIIKILGGEVKNG